MIFYELGTAQQDNDGALGDRHMVADLRGAFFVDGDDHCKALAGLDDAMMKFVTLMMLGLAFGMGIGLLVISGIDRHPDLPLPEPTLDLLTIEMNRLDAAWARFDASSGEWIFENDQRQELGRLVVSE